MRERKGRRRGPDDEDGGSEGEIGDLAVAAEGVTECVLSVLYDSFALLVAMKSRVGGQEKLVDLSSFDSLLLFNNHNNSLREARDKSRTLSVTLTTHSHSRQLSPPRSSPGPPPHLLVPLPPSTHHRRGCHYRQSFASAPSNPLPAPHFPSSACSAPSSSLCPYPLFIAPPRRHVSQSSRRQVCH
jgi:hypothetical protein